MWLELCPCLSIMNKLKLNAFAAMFTALSGNTSVPGNDVHSHIFFFYVMFTICQVNKSSKNTFIQSLKADHQPLRS